MRPNAFGSCGDDGMMPSVKMECSQLVRTDARTCVNSSSVEGHLNRLVAALQCRFRCTVPQALVCAGIEPGPSSGRDHMIPIYFKITARRRSAPSDWLGRFHWANPGCPVIRLSLKG